MEQSTFRTMVKRTIQDANLDIWNMDIQKYADRLYDVYEIDRKNDADAMRAYAGCIKEQVLRDGKIIANYQNASRLLYGCCLDVFMTRL